jgi:single-strand DNA-binding protein
MFETTVTVVGKAITQPTLREVSGDRRVATFRVAARSRRFDSTNAEWCDGDQFLATVHCWRRLADSVPNAVDKGDAVVVAGRLRSHEYEVDGHRRSATEIDATAVGLDLARLPVPGARSGALRPVSAGSG